MISTLETGQIVLDLVREKLGQNYKARLEVNKNQTHWAVMIYETHEADSEFESSARVVGLYNNDHDRVLLEDRLYIQSYPFLNVENDFVQHLADPDFFEKIMDRVEIKGWKKDGL